MTELQSYDDESGASPYAGSLSGPSLVSVAEERPDDPVGDAVADFISELLTSAVVALTYHQIGAPVAAPVDVVDELVVSEASAEVLPGWVTTITVAFSDAAGAKIDSIPEALRALPAAALRAAQSFRHYPTGEGGRLSPSVERAFRDTVIVELLSHHQGWTRARSVRRPSCSPTRSST